MLGQVKEKSSQARINIKDLEDKILDVQHRLKHKLAKHGRNSANERESRKWRLGLDVEDKVRDFLFELKKNSYMHEMRAEYRVQKNDAGRRRKSDPIPWQLATTAVLVIRDSGRRGSQKNFKLLLRLMKAEFLAIYFPPPAVAPKTMMISMEGVSTTSDDVFWERGIVQRLNTVPRNRSVFLVMHGHAGITTNMHAWARLARRFDSLSIYIAFCTQATRVEP